MPRSGASWERSSFPRLVEAACLFCVSDLESGVFQVDETLLAHCLTDNLALVIVITFRSCGFPCSNFLPLKGDVDSE